MTFGISQNIPNVPSNLRSKVLDIASLRSLPRHVSTSHTPYLGLRARLSQVWLNRWTVLLLLVLVRVLLTLGSLHDNIDDAREKALSACTKVEDVGSAMASMPHYLSVGVNDMSAGMVDTAVRAMVGAMDLALTVVESLIIFVINMMTSTYVCLVTSLIHSGLNAAANVTQEVTDLMNKAIKGVTDSISSGADSLQDTINKFADEIESSVFGSLLPDIPKVNFTEDLTSLNNIKINTTSFVSDLNELNDNIPTFEQAKNMTNAAISVPFDLIRDAITDKYANYRFDSTAFPIAQKQQLSFCSNNDGLNSFFDTLYETARSARTAFIVVLILLALAAMAPAGWMEVRRWRRDRSNAQIVQASHGSGAGSPMAAQAEPPRDPMDVVYIVAHPHSAHWGLMAASRLSGKNQILLRWTWAYMTTTPALFVLSLAVAGLAACLCQLAVLHALQKQIPALSDQVGDFAGDVVTTLQNASNEWAVGANSVLSELNADVNADILGWVINGTTAANNTLNSFTDVMETALGTAFNGTVLKEPISDVIYCLIGLKVATVQKGLTWLQEQANVSFAQFPADVFSAGANSSLGADSNMTSFLASPASVTTDEISAAADKIVNKLRSAITVEALISLGVLLVYVVVVLSGMLAGLYAAITTEKTRAEGGGSFTFADPHGQPNDSPPVYTATPTDAYRMPRRNSAATVAALGKLLKTRAGLDNDIGQEYASASVTSEKAAGGGRN
ncbi:Plasma membrane fusion protein PRM1 [Ceratocystis platani]|uniref:Plasma membrane fusion protein PRM1 n=1 Tax=Ceratocystis fimbriata f. sp. platani TaxID=88771 RepID=A0A0F8BQM5_CERFI|nr:Plasma membrane fusion protein PRM1 [Ceratocystis platani]